MFGVVGLGETTVGYARLRGLDYLSCVGHANSWVY